MTVVFASASRGVTEEDVKEVLAKRGLEVTTEEKPAPEPEPEPQRDAFDSEEDFEAAHVAWQEKQEEAEAEKEEAAEAEREKQEAAQPRRLSKFQKRVNKLTGTLRAELDAAKREIEDLKKGKGSAASTDEELKAPKREDFKSDEEFEEAKFDFRYQQRRIREDAEAARRQQQEHLQTVLETFVSNREAFKAEHDDFDEVVNQNLPMHQESQLAIMEMENAGEVLYYLGKHPEYTTKLAEMSPLSAVMEVGRLSAKLKAASGSSETDTGRAGQPKPKPKLPAPVPRVSTSASQTTLTTANAKSLADFRRAKAARGR